MARYAAFWQDFEEASPFIKEAMKANDTRSALRKVWNILRKFQFDFAFDLTWNDEGPVLILTPEGNHRKAVQIDALIAHAPDTLEWTVLGRRQRKPANDVFAILKAVYSVDATDTRVAWEREGKGINVTIYSDVVENLDAKKELYVRTFLDHLLGESFVMRYVKSARIENLSESKNAVAPQEFVESLQNW